MKITWIKRMNKLIALAVFVVLAGGAPMSRLAYPQAQEPSGAKRLFYDPATGTMLGEQDKKQRTPQGKTRVRAASTVQAKYTGIHYWIELDGGGTVTDRRVFYTGQRIRLHLRSNVDGYLSLWALDSSGNGKVIFPAASNGGKDNFVKADSEFALPGFVKFSPPPEDERMLIFFSRNKSEVPNAQDSITESSKYLANGRKSLEFETDENNAGEVGTYVVNRQGGPLAIVVQLIHKAPRSQQ